jgi:hypothetical protein
MFAHYQTGMFQPGGTETGIYAYVTATPTTTYYPTEINIGGILYQQIVIAFSPVDRITDVPLTLIVDRPISLQYLTVGGGGGGQFTNGGGGGGYATGTKTTPIGTHTMTLGAAGNNGGSGTGGNGGSTYLTISSVQTGFASGGSGGTTTGGGACGFPGGSGGTGGGGGLLPQNGTATTGGLGLSITFGNVTNTFGTGGSKTGNPNPSGWGYYGSGGAGSSSGAGGNRGRCGYISLLWLSKIV